MIQLFDKPEYSEETWNGLEKDKRWDLLEEYEREVEKAMGLDPVTIRGFCDNSGTVGYYLHSERTLYLSDVLLADREMALGTVRHELRHYYQNTLCDDLPRNHSNIFIWTIEKWEKNRQPGNYISDGPGYSSQPLENDADDWERNTG